MRPESTSETNQNDSRRITILRDIDAQRLAAGEVIERPASVVRELLDNAIDAGCSNIDVYIEDGGLKSIRVIDDGNGIDSDDLPLSILPHATSKIRTVEDLLNTRTLGFRGEALASIAACARIEITSNTSGPSGPHKLIARDGRQLSIVPAQGGSPGTNVFITNLFHSVPGRKRFLKRASTEGSLCRQQFIEKAISFPDIGFKYYVQGDMKLFIPTGDLTKRIYSAFPSLFPKDSLRECRKEGEHYSFTIVSSIPGFHRRDRKYIYIFVNNRRIQEYALVQAVSYGYSDVLPGGAFPYAFVFLDIDPTLVDFNIHPAKKEVRFKNLPEIHHRIVMALRTGLNADGAGRTGRPTPGFAGGKPGSDKDESDPLFPDGGCAPVYKKPAITSDILKDASVPPWRSGHPTTPSEPFIYHGQAFSCYLIAEKGDSIFLIDQHAAHERYLYNRFKTRKGGIQKLLVPIHVELEEEESLQMVKVMGELNDLGIRMEQKDSTTWDITGLPEAWHPVLDSLVDVLTTAVFTAEDFEKELFSGMACRSAVKDGDVLDETTAIELIDFALTEDQPYCPHGRPIYTVITREELNALVGR